MLQLLGQTLTFQNVSSWCRVSHTAVSISVSPCWGKKCLFTTISSTDRFLTLKSDESSAKIAEEVS